jgi:hypothetical protein
MGRAVYWETGRLSMSANHPIDLTKTGLVRIGGG